MLETHKESAASRVERRSDLENNRAEALGENQEAARGGWPGRVNKRNGSHLHGILSFAFSVEKAQIPIRPQNYKENHSSGADAFDPKTYRFKQRQIYAILEWRDWKKSQETTIYRVNVHYSPNARMYKIRNFRTQLTSLFFPEWIFISFYIYFPFM